MSEVIVQIDNVWKKYDMGKAEPVVVLKGINLEVRQGEFVAITGPSGSGKSTMVNMIGALDRPSWGAVYLKGRNIAHMSESSLAFLRGKTIGFIFQQFNLVPTLSALQNVMLPMEIVNESEKEAHVRARHLLESLGLIERLTHRPNQLSGGQQQRVAIARALANDPEVILADEPTGNLDSKTGEFVMNFLGEMHDQGKTVILITHDLDLVKYAKRIIKLKDGKIEP
ncbi:ABC transporter ATP-binding protein [Candidatus Woesearchaeota archaeon]|nr:ABC transporter ATP-binding protein [Candidatus Woesearchaeota archaeon]